MNEVTQKLPAVQFPVAARCVSALVALDDVAPLVIEFFRMNGTAERISGVTCWILSIRIETPDDHQHVRTVTVQAFANSKLGHNDAAELIDALRHTSGTLLSLVACRDGNIMGQILFTPVVIRMA